MIQFNLNDIFDKKTDRQEKYVLAVVLLECIIFPWIFLSKSSLACIAIFSIYLFSRFVMKNRFSILIIMTLFYLCPIEVSYVDVSAKMFWLFLVVRLCYFIELIFGISKFHRDPIFRKITAILIFLCFYDIIVNMSFLPITSWPQKFLYLVVPFFVILEHNFRVNFLFKYGDIVFVVTFLYLIGQWLGYYPYENLREQQLAEIKWVQEYNRLGGLSCNSLCLTIILLFEAVSIWSRFILYGKMNYKLLAMLIVALLLTISKTAIIGFLFMSLYGLYVVLISQRKIKLFVVLTIALVTIMILLNTFFSELFLDNITRLGNAQNELGHRFAAFNGVFNVFLDNPFGVGEELSYLLDTKYRTLGWIVGFSTLDNFFLTQIGKYGIFSLLYMMLYLYGFFYALKYRKNNKSAFHCVCMLYLCIAFISFSFNWEAYMAILSFICLFSALYIKILQNTNLDKYVWNNHC